MVVELIQGATAFGGGGGEVVWTGSIEDFIIENGDGFDEKEIAHITRLCVGITQIIPTHQGLMKVRRIK